MADWWEDWKKKNNIKEAQGVSTVPQSNSGIRQEAQKQSTQQQTTNTGKGWWEEYKEKNHLQDEADRTTERQKEKQRQREEWQKKRTELLSQARRAGQAVQGIMQDTLQRGADLAALRPDPGQAARDRYLEMARASLGMGPEISPQRAAELEQERQQRETVSAAAGPAPATGALLGIQQASMRSEDRAAQLGWNMDREQIDRELEAARQQLTQAEQARNAKRAESPDWRRSDQQGNFGTISTPEEDAAVERARQSVAVWEQAAAVAEQAEKQRRYESYRSAPDFAEKSTYQKGKDAYYEAVNGDERARLLMLHNGKPEAFFRLTDDKRALYNYIYKTQGSKAAEQYLYEEADTETTGLDAIGLGFVRGVGLSSLGETISALAGKLFDNEEELEAHWKRQHRLEADASQNHGIAYGAGNVAGNLALMGAAGKLTGAAAKALGLGKAGITSVTLGGKTVGVLTTPAVTKAATSAMTFALTDMIHNLGSAASGRMTVGEYLGSAGRSAAGGAAGSMADFLVSTGMANVLQRNGWMYAFGEYTRKVTASTAFAAANMGTRQLLGDQQMSGQEFAQQMLSSFLYNLISSGFQTVSETRSYKAKMDALLENIKEGYSRVSDAGMNPSQKAKLAEQLMDWTQQLRNGINSVYLPGQQGYVRDMNAALDAMTEMFSTYGQVNAAYADMGSVGTLLGDGAQPIRQELQKQIEAGIQDGLQLAGQPVHPQTPVTGPGAGMGLPAGEAINLPAIPDSSTVLPQQNEGGRQSAVPTLEQGAVPGLPAVPEEITPAPVQAAGQDQAALEEARAAGRESGLQTAAGMYTEDLAAILQATQESLKGAREEGDSLLAAQLEGAVEGLQQAYNGRLAEVDWNGNRDETGGQAALVPTDRAEDGGTGDPFPTEIGRPMADTLEGRTDSSTSLRSAQNDSRAAEVRGPYGGQIDRNGGLNDGREQQLEQWQSGRQGAVPTGNGGQVSGGDGGQLAERAAGLAEGGQRDAGLGTGGPAGGLGGGAEGSVSRGSAAQELAQLRNQIRALEAERRSAAQIGVNFGTKNESLRVVPEELYTSAMQAEQARAEENGVRLTFVTGGAIELRAKGGRIIKADGLHQVDADGTSHIFARADSRRFTPEQLTKHEDFHDMVANNRGLLLDMVDALYETQGEEGVARLVDAYVTALDGCYGSYAEGMTEDDQRELAMLYLEEIFADQYAGMNRSSPSARQAVRTAGDVAQRFAGDIENARQNRAGIDRRNGPGVRFSIQDVQGQNGDYPDCVVLDTNLFDGVKPRDWGKVLQDYVYNNFADKELDIYDENWYTETVKIARYQDRVTKSGAKNSHRVIDDLARNQGNNIKNLAVAHIPELLVVSTYDKESLDNNHQWLDQNGWTYRKAYICDKAGKIYEATLNIAEGRDRRILYDISLIKEIDRRTAGGVVPSTVTGRGSPTSRSSSKKILPDPKVPVKHFSPEEQVARIDADYLRAVDSEDMRTAQRMVDEAAKRAGYDMELYHGSKKGGGFTVFKDWQYFTPNKAYAERYMERDNPDSLYHVYVKSERMFDTRRPECREIFEQMRSEYGLSELQENGLPDWTDGYDITDFIEENDLDFDGVVLDEGGDLTENGPVSRGESYVIRKSEQVKSAEPVTRDDNGKLVPLSERFRTDRTGVEAWKNRDIRFSPAEDADEIDWAGKDAEEGRQIAGATVENGGRPMTAPTEERGRPVTAPTEEGTDSSTSRADEGIGPYGAQNDRVGDVAAGTGATSSASRSEAPSPQGEGLEADSSASLRSAQNDMAREKKEEIAARTSVEGLKSRIKTAEDRLRGYKVLRQEGLMTPQIEDRMEDVQETIDIMKAELDRKKAAKAAEKADQAKKAEAKAQRKAEKLAAEKAAELRDNRPREARKEFRQDALNLFSVPAAKRQTLGDLLNRFADKVTAKGSVSEADRRELITSLYEAGVETIQPDEYYKQIRDFTRGGRIYVPQELRDEFRDDWEAFRKRAWGNGIYLTKDQKDRGADAWNVELAELFPGSFEAGETDGRSILEGIVELAEEGKAEHVSIEEMMLRNQSETGVTVDEQMDELERKVDNLIDTFAQKADLEVKLRKAGTMQLVKERQKNREIAARQAQRKRENDTRSQVMKQLQQLNKMRKKSAPEIQRQIDEIIGNLDTMARSISPEGLENLQALARKYEEAKEDPNFLGNPYVEQRLNRLGQTQLDELEISDVIELGRTISALVKSVTEDKRLLTDARGQEIEEAAREVQKEIRSSAGSKGGKLRAFFGSEQLSPTREIQRLGGWVRGGTMEKLSRALEDGGTQRMEYQRQATRIFDRFLADKENQAWLRKAQGKKAEWISVTVPAGITGTDVLSGERGTLKIENVTFEITPMMRVGLLMHSKNVDNLRHIQTGGIVIPNKELYLKGDLANADAKGMRVKLQPEIVRAIVRECTPQERAFAGLLEEYYDHFSKDRINEVSMMIDGFERAGGEHYYQIKVSRKFLAAQPEQVQKNLSLESIGSIVNERIHAGNPITLEDASKALTDHIDQISKYYGYTAAIRDFNAVMNYTFHFKAETKEGGEYVANAYADSIKETLQAKWGAEAQKYLDNLLADLQQSSSINETAAQFMAKLRGNLAGASLMFNPAVALSQTASLPGAMQSLGLDGLVAALKPEKVDMGLVEKYSPVLWYRNQGNSTQELGDYMKQQGLEGKLPFFFNWIQKMDSWTIRRIWAGAEYRVSKDTDLSPGSQAEIDAGTDPYYQEVARVFQRAVYDTQPNYSEMQRPAILRSKSDLTKALTMYKTVPLQYYNMMYEAVGRLRADTERAKAEPNNKKYQEAVKQSRSFAAKTFVGILGANVTYVVMKALIKGTIGGKKKKYLDEEGDLDFGKILGSLGKDLIDTYAGSVIFGSDLLTASEKLYDAATTGSYSRYGGTEISFLSAIEDTLGGFYNLAKEIHDQDFTGGLGAVKDLAKQIAMVTGIPANNMETYILGSLKLMAPEWADRYENLFDEIERPDLKGEYGRDLRAALEVLMDNRTDGLKDETIEELLRLWGNGQSNQVPSAVPSSVTVDGESVDIRGADRQTFRESWGKIVSDNLEKLIASESYQQADDKGKASLIKKLYDYARASAVETVAGVTPDNWVRFGRACVEAGIPLEYYLGALGASKDKLKNMDGEELSVGILVGMQFRGVDLKDQTVDELGRLFAGGASEAVPSDVPTSVTVNGEKIDLSPEQRVAWMQAWGRKAGETLETVMGSKAYEAADDDGKTKLLGAVYDYARALASASVIESYAPDKWIVIGRDAEEMGIAPDEYITFRQQSKTLKSAEALDLLKQQDWTQVQKEYIWMSSMATEAQLNRYKPLKEAGNSWAKALELMGVGETSTPGMTDEEAQKYQAAWDRISGPATKRLMNNKTYQKADKATQSAYIDKLNSYVTQVAKSEVLKGYTTDKWVELGKQMTTAGVALDEFIVYQAGTSDAKSRDKYTALNKTGWTDARKLMAMEYISSSTSNAAKVGRDYLVPVSRYLDGLAQADSDQNGSINQAEAEAWLDSTGLGREDKAYLWQMLCLSSKWKNNPYSAVMGEEIWHSLHPEG